MAKWFEGSEDVGFEVRGSVAYVTLNRPEKRNALSLPMLYEIEKAMREADDLKAVRCVVLQGAGKDFSAGADFSDYRSAEDFDASQYRDSDTLEDDIWRTVQRGEPRLVIYKMHKPVIAKIQGNCLAAATDVALNCDILIAADDARIGFPASRALGSPANHMWLYHVGPQWAKRLLLTGDAIRGRDAAKIGLVLQSVPADQLDAAVAELARRISQLEPGLAAAHKRIVNLGLELMGWPQLQRLASENDARAHQSPALAEFMNAVKEQGVKEALRQRDEPFGNGEVTVDGHA